MVDVRDEYPFSVIFQNGQHIVEITLENKEDIFRIAAEYERFLIGMGIKYKIREANGVGVD